MHPNEFMKTTMDFHPQDWIIIVKTLTDYSREWGIRM
jgi:hypothetical protein